VTSCHAARQDIGRDFWHSKQRERKSRIVNVDGHQVLRENMYDITSVSRCPALCPQSLAYPYSVRRTARFSWVLYGCDLAFNPKRLIDCLTCLSCMSGTPMPCTTNPSQREARCQHSWCHASEVYNVVCSHLPVYRGSHSGVGFISGGYARSSPERVAMPLQGEPSVFVSEAADLAGRASERPRGTKNARQIAGRDYEHSSTCQVRGSMFWAACH